MSYYILFLKNYVSLHWTITIPWYTLIQNFVFLFNPTCLSSINEETYHFYQIMTSQILQLNLRSRPVPQRTLYLSETFAPRCFCRSNTSQLKLKVFSLCIPSYTTCSFSSSIIWSWIVIYDLKHPPLSSFIRIPLKPTHPLPSLIT